NPENADFRRAESYAHYYVATTLERLGKLDESAEHFRKCLELRRELAEGPEVKVSQYELALAEARAGLHAEAIDRIKGVLRTPPTNTQIYVQSACVGALASAAATSAGDE